LKSVWRFAFGGVNMSISTHLRKLPPFTLISTLAALLVATGAMGQPASSVPAATNARAERSMRATEVLQTLRERLPEVARVNGLQAAEVESLFGRERDLWIDRESRRMAPSRQSS
jgi:hypothetical protein